MAFSTDDTIVAIATPEGRGGLGVVRLSGPSAAPIGCTLIGRDRPLEPRHATFARIVDVNPSGAAGSRAVDQVVVTWFAAPHSYTGEDVVEISGHGSPMLLREIVRRALSAGARLAEPGEFTLRAYLNGRIDLVQAEAVADLVDAVTPLQARAAMDQLEGTLTTTIRRIGASLFDLAARLEASLDFPEEGFHFATRGEVTRDLDSVIEELAALDAEGRRGRLVREGRLVVLTGPPNAGKSSLFNVLAGAARAIVHDEPGTTRDLLTETIDLDGVPITLVDTAGLRDARDVVEAEGVARARQAREVAALSVLVLDASTPPTDETRRLITDLKSPAVIAFNKNDLGGRSSLFDASGFRFVETSALSAAGVEPLRAAILEALGGGPADRDAPAIGNIRHLRLVGDARAALANAREALAAGATEELVLTEITSARHALEEITGQRTPEDLLIHIFSRFCVGK